jgi:hypothetical protein
VISPVHNAGDGSGCAVDALCAISHNFRRRIIFGRFFRGLDLSIPEIRFA